MADLVNQNAGYASAFVAMTERAGHPLIAPVADDAARAGRLDGNFKKQLRE